MKANQFILTIILSLLVVKVYAQTDAHLNGRILDAKDSSPIAFASIYVIETEKGTMTDMQGRFSIVLDSQKEYHLRISCLGFASKDVLIKKNKQDLVITLEEQSIALEDFTVIAKYNNKLGSDATIGQEALEYIQPTSLRDIFTLIPGGKLGSNNMQSGQLISSRQAGADLSTSFGMRVSVNGVPMHNDGIRIQMSGLTGQTAMDEDANVSINAGVDLRTISTDHIERVTITKGISSAKEGNLSSGSIKVDLKKGASPLRARVKFDPKNKLFYVGKGLRLKEKYGTLYWGADVVHSISSIENTRGAYNRLTGQLNYNNQLYVLNKKVDINVHGSYVTSFNNRKSDELIEAFHEKYNTLYQRASLSSKINITFESKLISEVEFITSVDYTNNLLKHHKHVLNQTVIPLQQSIVEGESEGIYLPSTYDTFYKLDNKPITLFNQITTKKYNSIGENISYNFIIGSSLDYTKNIGLGAVTDPKRPPFPSTDYIRPRRNKDIPALINNACFIETKWRYHNKQHEINSSIGVREVLMLNLPSHYLLSGKMLFQPRMQAAYTLHSEINNHAFLQTIRIGYGIENKLPSVDYLYPDKVYSDFIALNAYFNKEEQRLLITNTKIQNTENENLNANKNRKIEIGYNCSYKGYEISLTAFNERMSNGVVYFDSYTPTSYTYYYELKHKVDTKPTREDFKSKLMKTFMHKRVPTNSAKVIKKGVEYQIHIPAIKPLKTEVEINGAYYKTLYTSGIPVMYRPAIMSGGQMYPYVGIFDGSEKRYSSTFNTNFWINTHIPDWKLIFTNFIQVVWTNKTRLGTDVDVYPARYMDLDGAIHELDKETLEEKPEMKSMKRDFLSSRYNETKLPVSLLWNLKLSKEFNEHIKLSFFADKMLTVNPKYKNAYLKTARQWHRAFFGVELTLNI